jgi:hypothetical protein
MDQATERPVTGKLMPVIWIWGPRPFPGQKGQPLPPSCGLFNLDREQQFPRPSLSLAMFPFPPQPNPPYPHQGPYQTSQQQQEQQPPPTQQARERDQPRETSVSPHRGIGVPLHFTTGQFNGKHVRAELIELQKADLGRKYVPRHPDLST